MQHRHHFHNQEHIPDQCYDNHEDQGQTDEDNHSNGTDESIVSASEGSDEEQW
jgi:hypothetical protein